MSPQRDIYILGAGAVGIALAACLIRDGRKVVAVRTSCMEASSRTIGISVLCGTEPIEVPVETIGLSTLEMLDGIVVVTAKAHANRAIALELKNKGVKGPLVIMQNGVGVERHFLEANLSEIYRCVLYMTAQTTAENEVEFRSVNSCPIGLVEGNAGELDRIVTALNTKGFPFHSEKNIQRQIWKKSIMNAVFNSICPLLDTDNGIFVRDQEAAKLAEEVVMECVTLTDKLGLELTLAELMTQLLLISKTSSAQLISTLQDIRAGRETEIESLNLEMARIAASQSPPIDLKKTEFLGKMVLAKSRQCLGAKL